MVSVLPGSMVRLAPLENTRALTTEAELCRGLKLERGAVEQAVVDVTSE